MTEDVEAIRVIVADDHMVVRAGLVAVLSGASDIQVVAQVANGDEAIRAFSEHRPDVVLMDIQMPVLDGIAAVSRLRQQHPSARVILLTTFDDEEGVSRGMAAGAFGYLLKDVGATELMGAIRKVAAGRKAVGPQAAEKLAERFSSQALTYREREVLELMALGQSNKQIAKSLGIADGTIKVHVANILEKLGAQGRSEAVAVAARRGLVRFDGAD